MAFVRARLILLGLGGMKHIFSEKEALSKQVLGCFFSKSTHNT